MSAVPCIWKDLRPYGPVVCLPTGEKYGAFDPDDNFVLREKCFVEATLHPLFIFPVRAALRALLLIPHSVVKGYENGRQQWLNRRVECIRKAQPENAPGYINLAFRIAGHILWTFFTDSLKLATLPLATLSIVVAGVWGMIFPIDGRFVIAKTEDLWSIDLGELSGLSWFVNYSAPCLQSKEVLERINHHRYCLPNYNSQTIRSFLFSIHREILQSKAYFSEEDYQDFKETIEDLRSNVGRLTRFKDGEETDENGKLTTTFHREQEDIVELLALRVRLNRLLTEIKTYKTTLENGQLPDSQKIYTLFQEILAERRPAKS